MTNNFVDCPTTDHWHQLCISVIAFSLNLPSTHQLPIDYSSHYMSITIFWHYCCNRFSCYKAPLINDWCIVFEPLLFFSPAVSRTLFSTSEIRWYWQTNHFFWKLSLVDWLAKCWQASLIWNAVINDDPSKSSVTRAFYYKMKILVHFIPI